MDESEATNTDSRREQRPDDPPLTYAGRPARPEAPAAVPAQATFIDTPVRALGIPRPDATHETGSGVEVSAADASGEAPPQERTLRGAHDGGYVRLTVHVENGELAVTDAREIEGPLQQDTTLGRGLAHEVRLGDRRLALGFTPDAGISRSIENIGPEGPREHHIQELPSYDFFVRVPRRAIAAADVSTLRIIHVAVTDYARESLDDAPLEQQTSLTVRPVAVLDGLRLEEIPDHVRMMLGPRPR